MDGGIKDLHKYGEEMSKNSPLSSQEQQEQESWMARAGGGREGNKGAKEFCPGWRHQPRQKGGPFIPVGGSNRDKSYLLSRAQRLPGQMACNKGLFCSSEWDKDQVKKK